MLNYINPICISTASAAAQDNQLNRTKKKTDEIRKNVLVPVGICYFSSLDFDFSGGWKIL